MTDITTIPLNKLTASKDNVRKTKSKAFIAQLAASIKAHGLQQNLIVRKDGKTFSVIAGGQRLTALQQLHKAGDINATFPVPCKVLDADASASEISLVENAIREAMHPADEFDAFRALVDDGISVADIAARFGVPETAVMQRLKLARVSTTVLKAYRKGDLTLAHVMAFAVSDDHDAQDNVLDNLSPYNREPHTIRDALTADEIAATDRRVKYVTLAAYEKAGGTTRRDLFSDDADGVFILDRDVLDKLVAEKLERAAKSLRREGWKWLEVHPDFTYEARTSFRRCHPELEPLSDADASRLMELQREYEALDEQWSNGDGERPARLDELDELIGKYDDRDEFWPADVLAIAGVVISINHDGKTQVDRGLVRTEDAPKPSAKRAVAANGQDAPAPAFSAPLIEQLTAQRSAALSAELLQRPDIALAAVVHAFASSIVTNDFSGDTSLTISASPQPLSAVEGSQAFTVLESSHETWGCKVPGSSADLWQWCLAQDQSVLLDLLGFCVASTVDAVQRKADRPNSDRLQHSNQLAAALNFDMAKWFTPTADNYFSRISKPQMLDAIREATGKPHAPAWEKLKKAELAAVAERETAGKRWLPSVLRTPA